MVLGNSNGMEIWTGGTFGTTLDFWKSGLYSFLLSLILSSECLGTGLNEGRQVPHEHAGVVQVETT